MVMQNRGVVTEYPQDGWLRGYFTTDECDVVGGNRSSSRFLKNSDFLRLKDAALHKLEPLSGKAILDVGCANGTMMVYCGLQGAEVYGQDLDINAVDDANQLLQRYKLRGRAVGGDAATLKFSDNSFDGVISSDFFEHITNDTKIKVLQEIRRVLKPGAAAVIKTPNIAYLKMALVYKRLRGLLKFQNPFKFVIPHTPGTDDPQHIGLVDRWQLTACLIEAGFVNYQFFYSPLRRFGFSKLMELASTEIPLVRDIFCEDVFCVALKPITLSHFPD